MREVIEDCCSNFELGDLTIEGPGRDPLAEQFEAMYFRLDQAAAMIAAPSLPDGSATHAALLAAGGCYAELFELQAAGYR